MAVKFGYIKSKLGTILGVTPFYPVGYIIEETSGINPEKWYGGVWELYGKGKVMACIDTSDTDTNSKTNFNKSVGMVIGSKYLQKHNHGYWNSDGRRNNGAGTDWLYQGVDVSAFTNGTGFTGEGDSQNIQPTILIYRWRKIAY